MNLTEAAEIVVRNNSFGVTSITTLNEDETARALLLNTMLSELDPTPISEERLRENGWAQRDGIWWRKGDCKLINSQHWKTWFLSLSESAVMSRVDRRWPLKTLGELRTLLRLMGGGGWN